MNRRPVRVMAAPYAVGRAASWSDFTAAVTAYADQASAAQAEVLLFPEYAGMDAHPSPVAESGLEGGFAGLQTRMPDFRAFHRDVARRLRLWLVAGSLPVQRPQGGYVNRAWIYSPDGQEFFQDKILMTRYERSTGLLHPGDELPVFQAAFGRFAVNICYDSEFPRLARCQAAAGADLLLVPSDTDTAQGHHRVRIGCQARALENQIAVIHCPLLGKAAWSPMIDVNVGAAACYVPPDVGFPENGVLAEGAWNDDAALIVEVPLPRVNALRRHGHVANFADGEGPDGLPVRVHPG